MTVDAHVLLLPGDGIGPEVVGAASRVLAVVAQRFGIRLTQTEALVGGAAIDATGDPLPPETLSAAREADAILLGAVGGPKWSDPQATVRPEQGLLRLRKELGLFANLRPVQVHPALRAASPLRPERLQGVDLLVVRELTGGIYFGQPRLLEAERAVDTMTYTRAEVQRVARLAFDLARGRRRRVTSVDKANVLACSRLWRQVVTEVAVEYPDVQLENLLVDAAAMHLLTRPADFDVILTANMFGDILTDEASVLSGSMGNLPSASLGEARNAHGLPRGLYEPIHGSAPDIAGRGIANPIGTILSAALLLRFSLGLEDVAQAIEDAVHDALQDGHRTADLAAAGEPALDTVQMTERILAYLSS